MSFELIQVIGAIGYSILAVSYFRKEKNKILFLQIVAYIFFTIHYYLLSGITGAICNLIGLVSLVIIYLFDECKVKNKNALIIGMIPVIIIIALVTYQNVFSIFPIIASVIAIMSFISDDENVIRGIGVICAMCWLIYAIAYKSYVAIVFEVITLLFVVIAFIRNQKNKKRGEQ